MNDFLKIAVAQISCALGDLAANLGTIDQFARRAKEAGAELVVFPEMSDTGYAMRVIREHAKPWTRGAVPELQEIAQTLSIAIISGVSERDGDHIYNSQVVIDRRGTILAKYRKTHLFAPAPIEEDKCCSPGDRLTSLTLGPFQFGLTICYDLRFPEIYRTLAVQKQVNVFVISSAWPFARLEHLRILATARAIENQSYIILANRVGADDGVSFCGASAIIDPSGLTTASAFGHGEELVVAELSLEVLRTVRERMKVFADRRPELYGRAGA